MSARLFATQWAGDVLVLTLDTPGCDFNIFSHEAAVQLLELLEGVDRSRVKALVIRSAKPASFINGVGLMMAGTAQAKPLMRGITLFPFSPTLRMRRSVRNEIRAI